MHWPCVRLSGLSTYGLKANNREMSGTLSMLSYVNMVLFTFLNGKHH